MQFVQRSLWGGFLCCALAASPAFAIECVRAQGLAERLVCLDPLLFRLDEALNQNYTGMIYSDIGDGARKWLRQSQRDWVRQRNRCTTRECLLSLYQVQVDQVCELPVISGIHAICITTQTVMDEFAKPAEGMRHETVR